MARPSGHVSLMARSMIANLAGWGLRCLSKKQKCEKHKRYSRKAEAKEDHRAECGVPGH